jgi:hypothetical protein
MLVSSRLSAHVRTRTELLPAKQTTATTSLEWSKGLSSLALHLSLTVVLLHYTTPILVAGPAAQALLLSRARYVRREDHGRQAMQPRK